MWWREKYLDQPHGTNLLFPVLISQNIPSNVTLEEIYYYCTHLRSSSTRTTLRDSLVQIQRLSWIAAVLTCFSRPLISNSVRDLPREMSEEIPTTCQPLACQDIHITKSSQVRERAFLAAAAAATARRPCFVGGPMVCVNAQLCRHNYNHDSLSCSDREHKIRVQLDTGRAKNSSWCCWPHEPPQPSSIRPPSVSTLFTKGRFVSS